MRPLAPPRDRHRQFSVFFHVQSIRQRRRKAERVGRDVLVCAVIRTAAGILANHRWTTPADQQHHAPRLGFNELSSLKSMSSPAGLIFHNYSNSAAGDVTFRAYSLELNLLHDFSAKVLKPMTIKLSPQSSV